MAENDDNSVEFSVVYKRRDRSEKNDDPHQCKTIVKIELKYMQKIGIHEGDIVKISGITKNTAAICLPMSNLDLQEIVAPKMEVEFLNNPGKKIHPHPKIIIYGPVSCNVDVSREWQQTVKLGKFPESQIKTENIAEAELVTLATVNMVEKMMSGCQSNLDYSEIMGFVVTKNDRINVPFQKEWHEKKQKELQSKENQEHPNMEKDMQRRSRPHTLPFPNSFQSAILDVKPEGKPFWTITGNTKFEFKETDSIKIFADPFGRTPKKLVNVVSISKQLVVGDTEFTIPSLEVYSNMMRLIWYSHQRIKIPESDFTDMRKMHRTHGRMHNSHLMLRITLEDDLGNHYVNTNKSEGGGSSGRSDPATREIISDSSWHHIFSPTLDSNAKKITLAIEEVQWIRQDRATMDAPPPTKPPHMTPIENQPILKIVIAEGPWTFSIPIIEHASN